MNPFGKKNIAGMVWELIEPVADSLGYRIWNVEYVREGADMFLRITIDADRTISIEDCERMTRAVDPILDEADPIEESYFLQVSSPGIERVLSLDEHFKSSVGAEIEIKLYKPLDGLRTLRGKLLGYDSGVITLQTQEKNIKIDRKDVAKAATVFDWNERQ